MRPRTVHSQPRTTRLTLMETSASKASSAFALQLCQVVWACLPSAIRVVPDITAPGRRSPRGGPASTTSWTPSTRRRSAS